MWGSGSESGAAPDLRALFLADQRAAQDASSSGAPQVGWGGCALPPAPGRVQYFGRNRSKGGPHREVRSAGGQRSEAASPPPPAAPSASPPPPGRPQDEALSVEELGGLVRRLPRGETLPERLFRALHHLDSRAVALLLKDLSKAGLDGRSIELFDSLRVLPERHLLRPLCDVYTYTAMISLCIYQQNVDRAMELLAEMRARGVERNVHTYTCVRSGEAGASSARGEQRV